MFTNIPADRFGHNFSSGRTIVYPTRRGSEMSLQEGIIQFSYTGDDNKARLVIRKRNSGRQVTIKNLNDAVVVF
jgi:hypothetical protein